MERLSKLISTAGAVCVLLAGACTPETLRAQPGPAAPGTAVAHYFVDSGELIVSVANVSNWYVQSESLSLTGPDDGVDLLPLAPGSELVLDNPLRIGEFVFGGDFTYTDADLGAVAEPNLPEGDLSIYWNAAGLSQPLLSQPVVYFEHKPDIVFEPPPPQHVGGRDLLIWQRGRTDPPLDPQALATWQANFGETQISSNATAIPEPTAAVLFACALLTWPTRSRQQ